MNFYTIKPTKKLADLVRYFWVFEGNASEAKPYVHRTFANVCPELLFHYEGVFEEIDNGNNLQSSFITGLHAHTAQHRRFVVKQPFGMFGVYLYPHALPVLFDTPAIALTNELPDLISILKGDGRVIHEKMLLASGNAERLSIITSFLERRITQPKRPEIGNVIKAIVAARGQVNIKALSSECFLSVRQFERNFKEQSGFAPKAFARIARFYAVVEGTLNKRRSLTEIAYDFGYYDQSHFISDFKEFSGFCPKTWFSAKPIDLCMD